MQCKCNVILSYTISELVEVANASSRLLEASFSHLSKIHNVTANLSLHIFARILTTDMRLNLVLNN